MTEGLKAAEGSSLSSDVFGSSVRTAIGQFILMKSIFRLLRKRSERDFVTIHDAALRGLVGVGRVIGAAAAVAATSRAAVVGVTAAAARVGAAIVLRVPRVRRARR